MDIRGDEVNKFLWDENGGGGKSEHPRRGRLRNGKAIAVNNRLSVPRCLNFFKNLNSGARDGIVSQKQYRQTGASHRDLNF